MGRNKANASRASSSTHEQPEDQEKAEEYDYEKGDNIAKTDGAPFPLLSMDEGARYIVLTNRDVVGCKYIPSKLLKDIQMLYSFKQLLTACGLKKFVSVHEPSYVDLVIEFYTSLDVNEKDSRILKFRMLGQNYQLTYSFMQ